MRVLLRPFSLFKGQSAHLDCPPGNQLTVCSRVLWRDVLLFKIVKPYERHGPHPSLLVRPLGQAPGLGVDRRNVIFDAQRDGVLESTHAVSHAGWAECRLAGADLILLVTQRRPDPAAEDIQDLFLFVLVHLSTLALGERNLRQLKAVAAQDRTATLGIAS